jgi:prepilin-type N-terminal cleavage/methylation domain-containing protein
MPSERQTMHPKQTGFTLIEIAIVLVIIGLLLGGLLKGQELITNARVRNIIAQQDGIKAAYFAFQDRYRALPGDYKEASTNIAGVTQNGNGDGVVNDPTGGAKESILIWDHLSHAGFITGSYIYDAAGPTAGSNPVNPYSAYIQLIWDDKYQGAAGTNRTNLKTGNQLAVGIVAEIDRKIDDGRANQGTFRFSVYNGGAAAPDPLKCFTDDATGSWKATDGESNCGGASLF